MTFDRYTIADASGDGKEGLVETIKLGLLFGAWYMANIYFNMYVMKEPHTAIVSCRKVSNASIVILAVTISSC